MKVNLGRVEPEAVVPNPVVKAHNAAGVKLSDCPEAVQTNEATSVFIVVAVEVAALGTLLQQVEITMFETPSHAKVEAEPEPVPKVNVFKTPAVGCKPRSVPTVPAYTCVKPALINVVVDITD